MTTAPKLDVDDIKSRYDLRDYVAGVLGGMPARHTYSYDVWHSPFRADNNPSFNVWSDHYHDFASGDHGDIISFIMQYENCDFKEAIERLGGNVPASKPKQHAPRVPSSEIRKIDFWTVEQNFTHIEDGLPFFHKRKISTPASYNNYLGVKPDHRTYYTHGNSTQYMFAAKRYAVPNLLGKTVRAINYRRDDAALLEAFWAHLRSVEVYDDIERKLGHAPTDAEIIEAIGGRKYEQEKGSKWRPFNVQTLLNIIDGQPQPKTDLPYVLVHAETKEYDTLALADHGYPTVGLRLNAEIEASLPAMFAKVPFVYVIRDNDEAGRIQAEKTVRAIGKGRIISPLTGFKDSGDVMQADLLDDWLFKRYGLEPLK